MLIQVGFQHFGDLLGVGQGAGGFVVTECFQRGVRHGSETGGIEFHFAVFGFRHAERLLHPVLGRVLEVGLEGGGADRPTETRQLFFGPLVVRMEGEGGVQLHRVAHAPDRFRARHLGFVEQMVEPAAGLAFAQQGVAVFLGAEHEQARRAQSFVLGVQPGDNDVQSSVLGPQTSHELQGVGGVREFAGTGRQPEGGPEAAGEERMGVPRAGHEFVGHAEDHHVRDRLPRDLHPAREVDGVAIHVAAERLAAGRVQGEADDVRGLQ